MLLTIIPKRGGQYKLLGIFPFGRQKRVPKLISRECIFRKNCYVKNPKVLRSKNNLKSFPKAEIPFSKTQIKILLSSCDGDFFIKIIFLTDVSLRKIFA